MIHIRIFLAALMLLTAATSNAQDGLVAHWSFDSLYNNTFIDHVSNTTGGTVFGAQLVPGPVGNALEFDGINDYARIPGNNMAPPSVLSNLTEGSISVWFRVDDIPMGFGIRPIFYYGKENPCIFFDAANEGMIIEVGHSPIHNGSRRLYFTMWTNGCTYPSFCYDSWNPIVEGQWYHYVAVVGANFNTGYLNGQLMTDRKYNFGNTSTHEFFSDCLAHENLWIGRGFWDSEDMFFDGAIDEIKIFDHPLNAIDVASLYAEGNPLLIIGKDSGQAIEPLVFPNPANETINIEFHSIPQQTVIVKIFDSTGELVSQSEISASDKTVTLDLGNLPKGLYVYSIEEDTMVLKTGKINIQ